MGYGNSIGPDSLRVLSNIFEIIWDIPILTRFFSVLFTMIEEIKDDAINNLLFRWTVPWLCKLAGPVNLSTAPWGHFRGRDRGRDKTRQASGSHMEGLLAAAHTVHIPGSVSVPSAKILPWGNRGCERVLEGQKARNKNFIVIAWLYSCVLAPSLS